MFRELFFRCKHKWALTGRAVKFIIFYGSYCQNIRLIFTIQCTQCKKYKIIPSQVVHIKQLCMDNYKRYDITDLQDDERIFIHALKEKMQYEIQKKYGVTID